MLILPISSPNKRQFFVELRIFKKFRVKIGLSIRRSLPTLTMENHTNDDCPNRAIRILIYQSHCITGQEKIYSFW